MKSAAASRNSSSTVSIRFLVSGPVSSMRWVPSGVGPGVQDPARAELLPERRVLRIVG